MVSVVLGVGYIGSALVGALLGQGRDVVGLDNLYSTDRRAIDAFGQLSSFRFVAGSILDPAAVERAFEGEVEEVYLLAAQASASVSRIDPDYTERANLQGPRVVLDALVAKARAAPLIYASSIRVYGSPLPAVVHEGTPPGAFGDLSHLSKCYVEKLLEMYSHVDGIATSSVRLGLTYGVAPVMKTDPRFMTAPNLFAYRAARGEPLEIRTAEPLALIHVDDAAGAMIASARAVTGTFATYNAAPTVATLPEIARRIEQIVEEREPGRRLDVVNRASARSDALHPVVSSALDPLGFRPRHALEPGLAEVYDHFRVRAPDASSSPS